MAKADRDAFFNGRKDENGKMIDRGVIGIRDIQGAGLIKSATQFALFSQPH